MAMNVKQMSRKELEKLRAEIDRVLKKLQTGEKRKALEAVKKAAKAHGFSLNDLTGKAVPAAKAKRGPKKKPAKAKYRNPANATQTWSGRGRRPAWVNEALAKGTPLSKFAI